MWDGKSFRTDLAHRLLVDPDNIVGWRYLNENEEDREEAVNESQGIDSEVGRISWKISSKIIDDWWDKSNKGIPDYKNHTIYRVKLHMDYEYMKNDGIHYLTEKMPITVLVTVIAGSEDYIRNTRSVKMKGYYGEWRTVSLAPMSRTASGDCQIIRGQWTKYPEKQQGEEKIMHACVRIIYDDGTPIGFLYSNVAHELMHAKSSIREELNAVHKGNVMKIRRQKIPGINMMYDKNMGDVLDSRNSLEDNFAWLRYYLSPNEMKSQVMQIYYEMRDHVIAEYDPDKKPNNDWAKEMIVSTEPYFLICQCEEQLNDPSIVEEAKHWFKWGSGLSYIKGITDDMRKHMTGISTPDDFIKYLKKNLKEQKLRLIKAGYKAFIDTMAEYEERDKNKKAGE